MVRRRYTRRSVQAPVWIVLLTLLVAAWRVWNEPAPTLPDADGHGEYVVQRVVDGDTLLLTNGQRVRLLGVDTPETKHPHQPVEALGHEASAFTRLHCEGRRVTLQFDRERQDRYQRWLAYVYVEDWFHNEELIRAGFSKAETQYPYSAEMKRRFRAAEAEARTRQAGLWGLEAPHGSTAGSLRPAPR